MTIDFDLRIEAKNLSDLLQPLLVRSEILDLIREKRGVRFAARLLEAHHALRETLEEIRAREIEQAGKAVGA